MRRKHFGRTAGASAFALGLLSQTSLAQNVPTAATSARPVSGLEQIVVTARRRDEKLEKVPVSVTALSNKALKTQQVVTANDLQFHTPNLQVHPDGLNGAGQPVFILRGQTPTLFTDDNVATYFAEVPQSTRGIAYSLFDMSSVQVYRGPQGTLFGKNSNGGAISFAPNRPTDTFSGYLQGQLGNYNDRDIQGMVNVPIVGNMLDLRVAGDYEKRDGIVRNLAPGQDNLDDLNHYSIRSSLLFKPTDYFTNLLVFDATNERQTPTPSLLVDASKSQFIVGPLLGGILENIASQQSALGPYTTFAATGPVETGRYAINSTNPLTHAHVSLDTANVYDSEEIFGLSDIATANLTDNIQFKNIFGYRNEQVLDSLDSVGSAGFLSVSPGYKGVLPASVINSGFLPAQVFTPQSAYQTHQISNEDQISGTSFNRSLTWIVGSFYLNDRVIYDSISTAAFGQAVNLQLNPHIENNKEQDISEAVYAQGTYDFSQIGFEGLKLTLGGRYNRDYRSNAHQDISGGSIYPDPGVICNVPVGTSGRVASDCVRDQEAQFHAKTYTADLDYQLTQQVLLYVATRHGFKSGGFNSTTVIPDYAVYSPETLTDYEVGVKFQGELFGMPVRSNFDAYYGFYDDIDTTDIITQPNATTALLILNASKATLKGFEYEGSIKPLDDLELDASYTYQKGVYTSGTLPAFYTAAGAAAAHTTTGAPNPAADFNLAGRDFPGAPVDQGNITATYSFSQFPEAWGKLLVSGNYAYRSATPGIPQTSIGSLPAYGIANASVNWVAILRTHTDITFWIKNFTDKTYRTQCSDNSTTLGYIACHYGDPLTFGFQARYTF